MPHPSENGLPTLVSWQGEHNRAKPPGQPHTVVLVQPVVVWLHAVAGKQIDLGCEWMMEITHSGIIFGMSKVGTQVPILL